MFNQFETNTHGGTTKMKKIYNIKIAKYFDKNRDTTVLELNVSKELSDLLKTFAITTETRETDWSKVVINEDNYNEPEYYTRYLIKGILKNSVTWNTTLDLLFTPEILNNQTIQVPLNSLRVFTEVNTSVESIKRLVKTAEEINKDREITINLTVTEE